MLGLLVLRGRWLIGALSGGTSRGAVAATSTTAAAGASKFTAAGGEVVSQFFVWIFVLVALGLLGGLVSMVVAEVRLRREIGGRGVLRRAERARLRAASPWYR
jgi:heme exporter protein D